MRAEISLHATWTRDDTRTDNVFAFSQNVIVFANNTINSFWTIISFSHDRLIASLILEILWSYVFFQTFYFTYCVNCLTLLLFLLDSR